MNCALGIDLGGSSIKAVAVTAQGEQLATRTLAFEDNANKDWAAGIRQLVQEIQSELKIPNCPIGLSAPGLAAKDARSIAFMPGRLQGLEGLNWTEFLEAEVPVPVLNDGHAALLGEAWLGAAKSFRDVIMFTLGTGVGGAALVEGKLLRGHIGRAGHFGHICLDPDKPGDVTGMPGSLEMVIGNCTIRERTGGRFQTTHDLVAAHAAGDAEATRIWHRSVRALACGIASCVNVLDPEAVVIGGGISRAGDLLFKPLETFLREVEWRAGGHEVRLLPAQLGSLAGACGAAWKALSSNPGK